MQNQINSYLANPNVDESAKSSARKQLEELSTSVNTYGSKKEARKFAISTLNSIASSLKPEDNYTPQYITPTTGIKASATFNPQIGEQKYNVAGLVTLQLAMSTKNKVRQVGMECVSNSKAVFEVMCEAIFIRSVWDDEKDPSEPTYIKPYRLKRDANGKFTGEKEYLDLDPNKQYKIVRLGKSRNDSTDKFLLYSVNFDFNIWREEGLCIVSDKNRY